MPSWAKRSRAELGHAEPNRAEKGRGKARAGPGRPPKPNTTPSRIPTALAVQSQTLNGKSHIHIIYNAHLCIYIYLLSSVCFVALSTSQPGGVNNIPHTFMDACLRFLVYLFCGDQTLWSTDPVTISTPDAYCQMVHICKTTTDYLQGNQPNCKCGKRAASSSTMQRLWWQPAWPQQLLSNQLKGNQPDC